MTKFLAAFLISTAFATPSLTLAHDHMSNDHVSHTHQGASTRTDLGEGLYMIKGQGGNMLFSTGDDGTFVIDTQLADTAAGNLALINEVSDTPVIFVLNTHYRQGHTGGNEIFVANGATIIAHENVRSRLLTEVENGKREEAALPVITFSEAKTLYWNDQQIEMTHLPTAHTDGDAMVRFPNANVIHTGGTLFSGQYPVIALEAGGTVAGTVAALKKISDISDADTQIVPGHGALSTKRDVEEAIEML
ncbi:MAG: MBL fold metallo-hydrolase, partial [Pseudomonadota bacterium]